MADSNVVLEGSLKYREGKKWKSRHCMIKKLSPVADRLHLSLYKDQHDAQRNQHEKANIPLEEFHGIDSCFGLDREQHVMGIICQPEVILLAFPNRETLIDWEISIRAHLGEEKQYPLKLVKAPSHAKLPLGPVKLIIQTERLCLTSSVPGTPPTILCSWHTSDLRRFGVIDEKFCFEAGTRCGRGAGIFVFVTEQGNEITENLQKASQGKLNKPRKSKRRSTLNPRSEFPGQGPASPSYSTDTCSVASFQDCSVFADHHNLVSEASTSTKVSSLETTTTIISDSSTSGSERLQLVDRDLVYQLYDFPPPPTPSRTRCVQEQNNLNACKDASFLRAKLITGNAAIHRRYSCSDLNYNIKTDEWSDRTKANGSLDLLVDNRRTVDFSELDNLAAHWLSPLELNCNFNNSVPPTLQTADRCLSDVERNIDALSPKIQKCESLKKLESSSSGNSSSNSTQCLFESHGNPKESQSSGSKMGDLYEEILKACEEFKTSSGSSTSNCSSTRDLSENTPSVSCDIGSVRKPRSSVVCGRLKSPTSPTSPVSPSSVANFCEQTMPSQCAVTSMYPRVAGCSYASPRSNVKRPSSASAAGTRTTFSPNRQQQNNIDRDATLDPLKPLESVDYQKYDGGDDEGYLYWLREVPGSKTPVCEPVRTREYENIPFSKNVANVIAPSTQQGATQCTSGTGQKTAGLQHSWSYPHGAFMSYHGSLRRQTSKGASLQYAFANTPSSQRHLHQLQQQQQQQQQDSAGAYITLKHDNYDVINLQKQGPRRKSVDDLLSDSSPKSWCKQGTMPEVLPDQVPTTQAPPVPSVCPLRPAPNAIYAVPKSLRVGSQPSSYPQSRDPEYMLMQPSCHHGDSSASYMLMQPGHVHRNPDDSYMLMAPGGGAAAHSDQYMLMQPGAKRDEDSEGEIFCAVDLPPKRSNSGGSSRDMLHSRNCSFSSASSTDPLCREDLSYMDMSLGRGQSNKVFSRSFSVRDSMRDSMPLSRPMLNHSKSWDNELDTDYLQMNLGQEPGSQHSGGANGTANSNYMSMTPGNLEEKTPTNETSANKPWEPFQDLMGHQHHLSRVTDLPPRPPGAPTSDKTTDPPSSVSQSPAKTDEETCKTSTNGKSPGLFSRLIRRSSTKDRKISKSQEDILSAPLRENTTVEESLTHSESFSEYPAARQSPQYPRRHSSDLLDQKQDRQRSMSFPGRTWRLDQGNLTDEQKQSCTSLLEAVPPPPSKAEFVHGSPATSATPPALPPKTYNGQQQRRGTFSNPGSRCSSHTKLCQFVSNSESAFTSESTLTPLHASEDDNDDDEEEEQLPEQPPELPAKSSQLRSRGSALFTQAFSLGTAPSTITTTTTTTTQSQGHSSAPMGTFEQAFDSSPSASREVRMSHQMAPSSVSPAMMRVRRVPPNLTVNIPSVCEEEDSTIWTNLSGSQSTSIAPSNPMPKTESVRGGTGRLSSERAETLSVSSCSSSGATSICSDDHKTSSPAATTLRPRFGKEYQKVDRRRLAEELNVPLAEQAALQAASVASSSVFTFDVGSLSSYNRSSPASAYSSGTDSPHSPSYPMRRFKDPDYVNISFPSSVDSPHLTHTPPPGSPRSVISGMSDFSNSVLNYAEIDLSHSESSKRAPRRGIHVRGSESATDYAMIDMVATAAASRVGKEHAQLREDSLRRKDSRSTADGEYLRRTGKDRKGSTSSSGSKDRKGISRSSSSAKDRKFSGPV